MNMSSVKLSGRATSTLGRAYDYWRGYIPRPEVNRRLMAADNSLVRSWCSPKVCFYNDKRNAEVGEPM